jgi:hypothetical protein
LGQPAASRNDVTASLGTTPSPPVPVAKLDCGWRRGLGVAGDLSRPRLPCPGPGETMLELTIMVVLMALLVLAGYAPSALDAMDRLAHDPDVDQDEDRNE